MILFGRSEALARDQTPPVRDQVCNPVAYVFNADIAKAFPNDEAVNKALRYLLEIAKASTRLTDHSSGAAVLRRMCSHSAQYASTLLRPCRAKGKTPKRNPVRP